MAKQKPAKKSASKKRPFTSTQGQYLAYFHLYRKLHRYSPSEAEIQAYFGVTPPAVHQMIVRLEQLGLITREPGVARSVRVVVPPDQIPPLLGTEDEPKSVPSGGRRVGPAQLYTLEVFLAGGPVPKKFRGQVVKRTIQIRSDQTLADLHQAIFKAYDRWDEHYYEFQFGKKFFDPEGPNYGLKEDGAPDYVGDVRTTTLGSLGLEKGRSFGYWFDFGDDWLHQIDVVDVEPAPAKGRFPKMTAREGASPPQYAEEEDEE